MPMATIAMIVIPKPRASVPDGPRLNETMMRNLQRSAGERGSILRHRTHPLILRNMQRGAVEWRSIFPR